MLKRFSVAVLVVVGGVSVGASVSAASVVRPPADSFTIGTKHDVNVKPGDQSCATNDTECVDAFVAACLAAGGFPVEDQSEWDGGSEMHCD